MEMNKYLVFKGANKNAKSNGDETPFSVADNDENNCESQTRNKRRKQKRNH